MYIPLITKYKPNHIEEFNISQYTKDLLKIYIKNNTLKFLIQGNSCTGKSSLINVLLNKIYNNDKNIINDNTIYINLLREQGINYYRNELKNYCQINNLNTNKNKKTIIIDDLDLLNEQCQQIFNTFINNYPNINFIISCNDIQKIKPTIINKLELIQINNINKEFIESLLEKILKNENIIIDDNYSKEFIVKSSNNSIPNMINIIEKINLIFNTNDNINIDENTLQNTICNILVNDLSIYIQFCIDKKIEKAIKHILNIYNNGFSVIDILEELFIFIKNYSKLNDEYKCLIVKIICKYINIFNNIHEDSIELIFLTNDIINIF